MNTHKTKIILLLSLALLFTLSACGGKETPTPEPVESLSLDYVIAEGHVFPARDIWLNFSAQGRVAEILIEAGEKVSRGQVLMRLDNSEGSEAALLAAELELISARQGFDDFTRTAELGSAVAWQAYLNAQTLRGGAEEVWEDLNLENLEDDIDDAIIEVRDTESDLEEALEEWEKYQDVDSGNYARQAAEDDLRVPSERLTAPGPTWMPPWLLKQRPNGTSRCGLMRVLISIS